MKNNFGLYDSIKGMLAANKPEPKEVGSLSEKDLAAYAKKQPGSVIGGVDFGSIKESKDDKKDSDDVKPNRIKLTKGWGDGGKSMKTSYGKLTKEDVELTEEELQVIADNITEEEFEQLDELSKQKLGQYIGRALNDVRNGNQARIRWQNHKGNGYHGIDPKGNSVTKTPKEMEDHHSKLAKNREDGIRLATKKLTKEDVDEEIAEGIFSEDEVAALLEMEQLDEIGIDTLRSYTQKNKADPKRIKTRGPTSKAQKAHIEKRDAGLQKARAKLDKHHAAEAAKAEANHKEIINHVHENMHDALSHHGYKHVGGDDNHVLYAKHLKGTSVMNHAIVHKPKSEHNSHNEHVLTLKSTTGWQNANNDRHRVTEHGENYRTLNTKHDAMTKLHNAIKSHDDYHAEKAKDHWLYK